MSDCGDKQHGDNVVLTIGPAGIGEIVVGEPRGTATKSPKLPRTSRIAVPRRYSLFLQRAAVVDWWPY